MGLLVKCDHPEGSDEEPISQEDSVSVTLQVNDPESGISQVTKLFCTNHGDVVLGTLEQHGFPEN